MESPGVGSREAGVCGSSTHCSPLPCVTVHPSSRQEYLSSSLAALHSNQIIALKVCRFCSRRSRPRPAERLPGRRAQHCTSSGPKWEGMGLWVQQWPRKAAMT